MANEQFTSKVDSFRERFRKNRRLKRISAVVAVILACMATVALVIPAVTLEYAKPSCGLEEHQHTEECYETVLTCELPEGKFHVHSPACYDADTLELTCTKDAAGHMHVAACLDENGVVACGQEETVHMHTAACFDETGKQICDSADAAHIHGDTCYKLVETPATDDQPATSEWVLTCTEPSGSHVHNVTCLDEDGDIVCGIVEDVEDMHKHDESCYEEVVVCGKEEHVHTDLCYDEINSEIMKDKERDELEAAESDNTDVVVSEPEADLTDDEIAEAKDQGLLFENDAMIIAFDVPDDIKDDIVLSVTEEAVEQADDETSSNSVDDVSSDDSDDGVEASDVEANVAEALEEPAYITNLRIEATIDGKPVTDIADLGIKAKLQMKSNIIAPILSEIDYSDVDPDIKDEVGAEISITQQPFNNSSASISELKGEQVDEVVVQSASDAATTFELLSNTVTTKTVQTANPSFTVQFYALVKQFATKAENGDVELEKIIDTSGGKLPVNGKGEKAAPGTSLRNLVLTENNGIYKVKTVDVLTEMYKAIENNKYIEKPNANYFNKLQENSNYKISEVWVLNATGEKNVAAANAVKYGSNNVSKYWDVYKSNDGSYHFTNREEYKDKGYIYIHDGAVLRMVNETTTAEIDANNVQFYDYDISNGSNASPTTTGSRSNRVNTQYGINSNSNYSGSGTKLAFGNVNTGTGLGAIKWNGNILNGANLAVNGTSSPTFEGCTFGLVKALSDTGYIQYADGVSAPKLFNEGSANGKTEIPGKLVFSRLGDSYTLQSAFVYVNGKEQIATSNLLDEFNHPSPYSGKTHTHIYTNNFWPMDKASTYGASGHDIKFGNYTNRNNRKYNGLNKAGTAANTDSVAFPYSDDGKDHNSFFGMKYEVEFDLSSDYIGPLEYLFFGDDDLWVFLDNKLVVDIGGVHSSVGEYTNLWDYLPKGSEGHHKLSIFYTERGASGSTCFMGFTLPSVSSMGDSRSTGSLVVNKVVDGAIDNPDEEFTFNIKLYDTKGTLSDESDDVQLIDDFAYVRYHSDEDQTAYTYVDEDGNTITKETLLHDDSYFKLKGGEHIVLSGLPVGTRFVITEQDPDGKFITSSTSKDLLKGITTTGEQIISGVIPVPGNSDGEKSKQIKVEVTFNNTQAYELPATGGVGTHWYFIGGTAMIALALIVLRRQRVSASKGACAASPANAHRVEIAPSGKPELKKAAGQKHGVTLGQGSQRGGKY